MKEQGIAAPAVQTLGVNVLPEPFIDEQSDATYYGWAVMGTNEDEPGWRIMRVKKTGTVTKSEYANGSMAFNFAWSERLSYVYSR